MEQIHGIRPAGKGHEDVAVLMDDFVERNDHKGLRSKKERRSATLALSSLRLTLSHIATLFRAFNLFIADFHEFAQHIVEAGRIGFMDFSV